MKGMKGRYKIAFCDSVTFLGDSNLKSYLRKPKKNTAISWSLLSKIFRNLITKRHHLHLQIDTFLPCLAYKQNTLA